MQNNGLGVELLRHFFFMILASFEFVIQIRLLYRSGFKCIGYCPAPIYCVNWTLAPIQSFLYTYFFFLRSIKFYSFHASDFYSSDFCSLNLYSLFWFHLTSLVYKFPPVWIQRQKSQNKPTGFFYGFDFTGPGNSTLQGDKSSWLYLFSLMLKHNPLDGHYRLGSVIFLLPFLTDSYCLWAGTPTYCH